MRTLKAVMTIDVCFLGAFNFPDISWDPVNVNSPDTSSELLSDFLSDHLFSQYILQPTRQNNILELFIMGSASLVTHVTTSERLRQNYQITVLLKYFSLSILVNHVTHLLQSLTLQLSDLWTSTKPTLRI